MSHISSILENRHTIHIIDDDDDNEVVEVPAPTPSRRSTRQPSRRSMFVTPGPDERRTTETPFGRRSTSALQARRASSAPHVHASSPQISSSSCIDLTGLEDSDEEAESEDVGEGKREDRKKEESTVQPKDDTMSGANQAADGIPVPGQFNLGTKRSASEGGGDTKRQKSEYRAGSLPVALAQTWSF